jgi:glutamate racemase
MGISPDSAIGIFDSGIGGLSILDAMRAELPFEDFVYVADSGHAPYGERDPAHVIERSRAIAHHLLDQHHIKALVIACNTATAAAIHLLRQQYPELPIVGVEPALKPAATLSRTGRIGVMATRGTLSSPKFQALMDSLRAPVDFIRQSCDGLADAIERGDASKIEALCMDYTSLMGEFGSQPGQIDTLVLGCTHYAFAASYLRTLLGPQVQLIDSGIPVARQARRLLQAQAALGSSPTQRIQLFVTGDPERLQAATRDLLHLDEKVKTLSMP